MKGTRINTFKSSNTAASRSRCGTFRTTSSTPHSKERTTPRQPTAAPRLRLRSGPALEFVQASGRSSLRDIDMHTPEA